MTGRLWAGTRRWLDERLSSRDRRALRWGALLLAPVLLWSAAVAPWLEAVGERRDHIASLRTLAAAEAELLATGDRYPGAVETGARRVASLASRLLDRRSEGIAVAEVHQIVEDLARATGVHLASVQPRGVEAADPGLSAAAVDAQGESDLLGLLEFLRAVEAGPKLLRAHGLRVRVSPDRSGHQVLSFRVSVVGYLIDLDARHGPVDARAGTPGGTGPSARGRDSQADATPMPLAGREGPGS